jgi:hypothetical protein
MTRKNLLVLCAFVLVAGTIGLATAEDVMLRDLDGIVHGTIERMTHAKWTVLFFLMTDCPIANRYAPEIQRICTEYGPKGAQCFLVYVDPSTTGAAVRQHKEDYKYSCCPAILDSEHQLVRKAGATVRSEVAVFSNTGELKYRGRIDNFYAGVGAPRQLVTQHDLRDTLDALIAGRKVPNPITQAFGCFISN